jgi:hypothetical protein
MSAALCGFVPRLRDGRTMLRAPGGRLLRLRPVVVRLVVADQLDDLSGSVQRDRPDRRVRLPPGHGDRPRTRRHTRHPLLDDQIEGAGQEGAHLVPEHRDAWPVGAIAVATSEARRGRLVDLAVQT